MEGKSITTVRKMMYVVLFIVASLPVACNYVMSGGDILLWLARIEEVKNGLCAGSFILFPTAEVTVAYNGGVAALNSNLWLFLPAMIRMVGGSITTAYRLYMLLLSILTVISAKKLFEQLYQDKNIACMGTVLYITCPYRIYVCYDKGDLGMAAAWSLIPLFLWAIFKICEEKIHWKNISVAAVAFAAIGYANGVLCLFTAGLALLLVLYKHKISILLPLLVGGVFYLPCFAYLARYLVADGMSLWNIPVGTISAKGYRVGQFFTSWAYLEDCPGLGLGLLGALFVLLWLWIVEDNIQVTKKHGFFVLTIFLFGYMSMLHFPWDIVQRVGAPFLRLISLMETPGICFGFAGLAACVLGTYGVECVAKQRNLFVRVGIPLMIMVASIGVAVYMCNTLTYVREPMFLIESL